MYYLRYLSWNFPIVPVSATIYIYMYTYCFDATTYMYVCNIMWSSCSCVHSSYMYVYIIRYTFIHSYISRQIPPHVSRVWAHASRSRWTHAWTWREAWAGREAKHRFTREGTRLTFFSDVSRRWHVSRKLDSRVGAHVSRWRPQHCSPFRKGPVTQSLMSRRPLRDRDNFPPTAQSTGRSSNFFQTPQSARFFSLIPPLIIWPTGQKKKSLIEHIPSEY